MWGQIFMWMIVGFLNIGVVAFTVTLQTMLGAVCLLRSAFRPTPSVDIPAWMMRIISASLIIRSAVRPSLIESGEGWSRGDVTGLEYRFVACGVVGDGKSWVVSWTVDITSTVKTPSQPQHPKPAPTPPDWPPRQHLRLRTNREYLPDAIRTHDHVWVITTADFCQSRLRIAPERNGSQLVPIAAEGTMPPESPTQRPESRCMQRRSHHSNVQYQRWMPTAFAGEESK